jgi:peptidoglycan hydrolase-like protein with peptidoglycan-binding domain
MKNKTKIILLSVVLLAMFAISNTALASEVTGTLSTGISSPGVIGVVIAPPVASPVAGTYDSVQNVTLTAPSSTSIHYTIDNTSPTCSTGTVYSGSISVGSSLTIEAISCYPNNQQSTVASYLYTINPPTLTPPSFSGPSGSGGGGGGSSGGGSGLSGKFLTTSLPTTEGSVLGASTGGGFQFTRTLKLGMSGQDVMELQNVLTAEGVYNGPVTGYFGPLTMAGVKAFQSKYGIAQTGTVGPLTLAKLNQLSGSVLGAQTTGAGMTVDQMKTLLAQLQAQVVALLAKLKNQTH